MSISRKTHNSLNESINDVISPIQESSNAPPPPNEYEQERLVGLGQKVFDWHLADRQSNYHVGQIKALEAEYGSRGSTTHHYLEMKKRMTPEDQKMHDFHDQQNAHHNRQMRTMHRYDDVREHMLQDGVNPNHIRNTITLARELAHSVPIVSASSHNEAGRFRDILGVEKKIEESVKLICEGEEEVNDRHRRLGQAAFAMHTHAAMIERHQNAYDELDASGGSQYSHTHERKLDALNNAIYHHGGEMAKYYNVLSRMKGNRKHWSPKEQNIINLSKELVTIVHGANRENQPDPEMSKRFLNIMGEDVLSTPPADHATDNSTWEKYKNANGKKIERIKKIIKRNKKK